MSINVAGEGTGGSRGEDCWSLESIPFFIKLPKSAIFLTFFFISPVRYNHEIELVPYERVGHHTENCSQ